jgi:hypothetical protein
MNDLIINCIVISLSISLSNLVVQYIIEVWIRKTTYVTLAEFNAKMALLDLRVASNF